MIQLIPTTQIDTEWWNLYTGAFPAEERRGREMHVQALLDTHFHAFRLQDANEFVGLLTWWQWEDMLYVEHLAIAEEKRGKGYGHAALAELQQRGQNIILEIEQITDEITARRLEFYRSCGFRALPYPHVQLAYQQGFADIPLLLLAFSRSGKEWGNDEVARFETLFAHGPMRYRDACMACSISPESKNPLG
ncbi:MAG: GNAT family N-acetyltransferase [Akkermansia sp.]|nr:GNAT family N-acetyltransferase [Akkermansia sp.]